MTPETDLKVFCLTIAGKLSPIQTYDEVLKLAKQIYRELTERQWGTPPAPEM